MASTPAPVADEDEDEALKDAGDITEIVKLDPSRMDGVYAPANGAPFLLIKSIADTGGADMTATATETENPQTEEAATEPGTETAKATSAPAGPATPAGGAPASPAPAPIAKDGDDDSDDGEADEGAEGETDDGGGAEADAGAAKATPAAPTAGDRAAYERARRAHEATEPTTKGALDGTDVLRARAEWNRWNQAGKAEGLDGTPEGMARWAAKNAAATPPAEDGSDIATDVAKETVDAEHAVYKRDIDTETRRRLAAEGKALPNLSYPIENKSDLDNAATLARSGHGDVAAARRLIARRAKELGTENPLSGDDKVKSGGTGPASKAGEAEVAEDTAGGAAEPAPLDPETAIQKAAAAGLITREVADGLLAKVRRPLPATTEPAGPHREPDGSTSVEQLEPQAGLPTDRDSAKDKTAVSVDAAGTIPPANAHTDRLAIGNMGKGQAPYPVQRMHDALCPAYGDDAVIEAYPALKSVMDALDSTWLNQVAIAKQAQGKTKKAGKHLRAAKAVEDLRATDPLVLADARAGLRKAFTDAYPDTRLSPRDRVQPGSFKRPYLTAGHATNSPVVTGTQPTSPVPPSAHVPEPQQFGRGYLTAGHASPSPADHGHNNPNPPGSSGNEYYSTAEQDMARRAQMSIHDHIQATFAGACPMAPTRHALPTGLGMGASNAPEKKVPGTMGGIPTVGDVTFKGAEDAQVPGDGEVANAALIADLAAALAGLSKTAGPDGGPAAQNNGAFGGKQAPAFGGKKKKGGKKKTLAALKTASEAGARAALEAMKAGDGAPGAVTAIVAEQIRAALDPYSSQITALTKQVEELGSQADPAQAPVRGQLSRPEPETAAPVEKRSLVQEAAEQAAANRAADEARFAAYMRTQAERHPDPKIRTRAEEVLRTIPAA